MRSECLRDDMEEVSRNVRGGTKSLYFLAGPSVMSHSTPLFNFSHGSMRALLVFSWTFDDAAPGSGRIVMMMHLVPRGLL